MTVADFVYPGAEVRIQRSEVKMKPRAVIDPASQFENRLSRSTTLPFHRGGARRHLFLTRRRDEANPVNVSVFRSAGLAKRWVSFPSWQASEWQRCTRVRVVRAGDARAEKTPVLFGTKRSPHFLGSPSRKQGGNAKSSASSRDCTRGREVQLLIREVHGS